MSKRHFIIFIFPLSFSHKKIRDFLLLFLMIEQFCSEITSTLKKGFHKGKTVCKHQIVDNESNKFEIQNCFLFSVCLKYFHKLKLFFEETAQFLFLFIIFLGWALLGLVQNFDQFCGGNIFGGATFRVVHYCGVLDNI